jgi:hypothetical protein
METQGKLKYWAAGDAAQQNAQNYINEHGGKLVVGSVSVPCCDDKAESYSNAYGVIGNSVKAQPGDEFTMRHSSAWWDKTVFTVNP